MPTWKKASPKNLSKVFAKIIRMPEEDQEIICEKLNDMLDDLRDGDFFGTEGQCDPRGDPRS